MGFRERQRERDRDSEFPVCSSLRSLNYAGCLFDRRIPLYRLRTNAIWLVASAIQHVSYCKAKTLRTHRRRRNKPNRQPSETASIQHIRGET